MQLDKQNMFSEAQDIAEDAGTVVSTNAIDLGAAGTTPTGGALAYDIGRGADVQIFCQITQTVTSAGAATVEAQLVMSDNADLSSPTVLLSTGAIDKASLVAGYQFRFGSLPPGISKRYLGMNYIIGTATTTAGTVTSGIVGMRQTSQI